MTDFGLLLKTLRSNANLTQQALAEQVGIKNGAISKWERGESFPDIFTIRKLSDVLNISCDDLLHPTATLVKMNEEITDHPSDISDTMTLDEVTKNTIPTEDASPEPLSKPKHHFFPSKNAFLLCIPIFILGVLLGVIASYTISSYRPKPSEQFTFVEANTAVDSRHGPAYELVYHIHNTELTTDEIIQFSNSVANDWDKGKYPDSTEHVLIINFYAPDSDLYKPDEVFFASTYFK